MRRFTLLFLSLAFIVLTGAGFPQLSAQSAAKKPFTFEDMMSLQRIGGPVVSPNGKWVLFSATDVNLKDNKRTSHLWVVAISGGTARQLPTTAAGERGGRLSPDGKSHLYISSEESGAQVSINGFDPDSGMLSGLPHRITNISTEADGAIWSPDGKN